MTRLVHFLGAGKRILSGSTSNWTGTKVICSMAGETILISLLVARSEGFWEEGRGVLSRRARVDTSDQVLGQRMACHTLHQ